MFEVVLEIKGDFVRVTVTNTETKEAKQDFTYAILGEAEEAGRAKAEKMIALWKAKGEEKKVISYITD